MAKPKVIKDFDKLSDETKEQLLKKYPYGFEENLISYMDKNNKKRLALPFETNDFYYLIRMNEEEAVAAFNELDEDDDSVESDDSVLSEIGDLAEGADEEDDDDEYDKEKNQKRKNRQSEEEEDEEED